MLPHEDFKKLKFCMSNAWNLSTTLHKLEQNKRKEKGERMKGESAEENN